MRVKTLFTEVIELTMFVTEFILQKKTTPISHSTFIKKNAGGVCEKFSFSHIKHEHVELYIRFFLESHNLKNESEI